MLNVHIAKYLSYQPGGSGVFKALRETGRRVSEDVSVIGWNDIQGAAFHNLSLTTVRQPLRRMGVVAAETLLKRLTAPGRRRVSQRNRP